MLELIILESTYFIRHFFIQFEEIYAFWLWGIFLGSFVSVFGKEKIHLLFQSMQDKSHGALGIIPASFLGILSPLCMYGTIPIAASFSEKGMKDDWLAAFMMGSILLNPQLLIYSAALGKEALLIRFVSCLLCGIAAGIFVRFFYKRKSFFNFTNFSEPVNNDTHPNLLARFGKNVWRNFKATGIYFIAGVALAALFQRYIPAQSITRFFGEQSNYGVLMAATVGVPLYVCGGGTIPLLANWLQAGMSIGAGAAFMISGPATKVTNLGALKIVLGKFNFALYLFFIILSSLLTGLCVNLLY